VLPVLHLNGSIYPPTRSLLARIAPGAGASDCVGYGWNPAVRRGHDPRRCTQGDGRGDGYAVSQILAIRQRPAVAVRRAGRPWPMIVLRSPKGWTGPSELHGKRTGGLLALAPGGELPAPNKDPEQLQMLETWLRKLRPDELLMPGALWIAELQALSAQRAPGGMDRPACPMAAACAAAAPATIGGPMRWRWSTPARSEHENTYPLGELQATPSSAIPDGMRVFRPLMKPPSNRLHGDL